MLVERSERYFLQKEEGMAFVFVPQVIERQGSPSSYYPDETGKYAWAPSFSSAEESIHYLIRRKLDGQVMRFVKPLQEGKTPSITAGVAARVYIDTSGTDLDPTQTLAQLHEAGYWVAPLYKGPFCKKTASKIMQDMEETKRFMDLMLVKQGDGYNVVEVIASPE